MLRIFGGFWDKEVRNNEGSGSRLYKSWLALIKGREAVAWKQSLKGTAFPFAEKDQFRNKSCLCLMVLSSLLINASLCSFSSQPQTDSAIHHSSLTASPNSLPPKQYLLSNTQFIFPLVKKNKKKSVIIVCSIGSFQTWQLLKEFSDEFIIFFWNPFSNIFDPIKQNDSKRKCYHISL